MDLDKTLNRHLKPFTSRSLGMFPLLLAVLSRDYSTPLLESLSRTVSIRGNIPT